MVLRLLHRAGMVVQRLRPGMANTSYSKGLHGSYKSHYH